MKKVTDLRPEKVELLIKDNIVMIDIRRDEEFFQTGVITNAYKLTFFDKYGNYNLDYWMEKFQKLVTSKNQTFVLICAHANRTKTLGNYLVNLGYNNCAHLYGGMALWLKEGREVVFN